MRNIYPIGKSLKSVTSKAVLVYGLVGLCSLSLTAQTTGRTVSKEGQTKSLTQKATAVSSKESVVGERIKSKLFLQDLIRSGNTSEYVVTSEHVSSISGIHHIYVRQAINGVEVMGTESSVHLDAQGKAVVTHVNFIKDIDASVKKASAGMTAEQAIAAVAQKMNYGAISNLQRSYSITDVSSKKSAYQNRTTLYTDGGVSSRDIPTKKMHYYREGVGVVSVWELSIMDKKSSDWYNFIVDASTGEILYKFNQTTTCTAFEVDHSNHDHNKSKTETKAFNLFQVSTSESEAAFVGGGTYNVFAMPVESPYYGGRTIESDPADAIASPYGWHDINGAAGAEYTYTRGNNTSAYDDDNDTNSASNQADYAEGGALLDFDFSFNQNYTNGNQSEDAAVTNTFFWANIIHDVVYLYGFDEASGNFQENNYGNGGVGGDSVFSEAQDGSGTCNANFGTPPEGSSPRMQMYVCGNEDGDYDNVVIAHEYTHGISTRLTGGAANSGCLTGQEQMGEGWGDFLGMMMTIEPGDVGTEQRTVGNFLFGQGINGPGIRPQPYSTTNTQSYADLSGAIAVPHGVGSVWAAILWKLNWELIAVHGYDPDIYYGTGGNNKCLALVMEGLKLQGCNPDFVSGLEGILAADIAINGGENVDMIWQVFSDAGIGYGADAGTTAIGDETTSTVFPPAEISFSDATATVSEGSDCAFTDVTIPLTILVSATANASADFTVQSTTGTEGVDFDLITPSVSFTSGIVSSEDMILRVYHDGFVEGDETVTVNFTVNANGGDAVAGTNSFVLTIADDDIAAAPGLTVNLLTEDFENPVDWTSIDADGDTNDWLLRNDAWHGYSGNWAASMSWDGTAYTPNNYLMSPAISIPLSATSVDISYLIGSAEDPTFFAEHYSVYFATDITDEASILATGVVLENDRTIPANGTETRTHNNLLTLNPALIGQTGYFVVRHHNTFDVWILGLDDVVIDVSLTTGVQTTVNAALTNDLLNLTGAGTVYTEDALSRDVMLDINSNNAFDYGCIDVSVSRAGATAQAYNGSSTPNLVMDKVFTISPTNTTSSGINTLTFYFEEAEVAGWEAATGLSRNVLEVSREGSTDVSTLVVGAFGTHVTFTGTFSGLAGDYYFGPNAVFSRVLVAPKVYLAGAAVNSGSNLMRDDLRVAGFIPTTSPYDAATCNASVFNITGTNAIVDWVYVELRDQVTNTTVVEAQSALLQADGDVVGVDGVSVLSFNQPGDRYFIAINHRNHLAIMSDTAILLSSSSTPVDFSDSASQITIGTDAQTSSGMPAGIVAMWPGDTNANDAVSYQGAGNDTNTIKDNVIAQPGNTGASNLYAFSAYDYADVNMDGTISYQGAGNDSNIIKDYILAHPSNAAGSNLFSFTKQF